MYTINAKINASQMTFSTEIEIKLILSSSMQYDNTSNYGKKIEVIESCPEFNSE